MDKLIETDGSATITNDGATVISLLNISHPAAALLADAAKAQDMEAGDGTTSVVVLAGALLQEAREFVQEGMAPQIIIKGFRTARNLVSRSRASGRRCQRSWSTSLQSDSGLSIHHDFAFV